MQLSSERLERARELASSLKTLVVPSCIHVGEQFAFSACKEKLASELLALLGAESEENQSATLSIANTSALPLQYLRVDQRSLAKDVIDKTFDQHRALLRAQLEAAEKEAAKWKRIANGGACDVASSSTQTEMDVVASERTQHPANTQENESLFKSLFTTAFAKYSDWITTSQNTLFSSLYTSQDWFASSVSAVAANALQTPKSSVDGVVVTPPPVSSRHAKKAGSGKRKSSRDPTQCSINSASTRSTSRKPSVGAVADPKPQNFIPVEKRNDPLFTVRSLHNSHRQQSVEDLGNSNTCSLPSVRNNTH